MWTRFMDMHSGGGRKLDWEYIFIEATQDEAEVVFYNKFDRSPSRVTCTCCGEDYYVSEYPTLEQASEYERRGEGMKEFALRQDVLIIPASSTTTE